MIVTKRKEIEILFLMNSILCFEKDVRLSVKITWVNNSIIILSNLKLIPILFAFWLKFVQFEWTNKKFLSFGMRFWASKGFKLPKSHISMDCLFHLLFSLYVLTGKSIKASNNHSERCFIFASAGNFRIHVCWWGECVARAIASLSKDRRSAQGQRIGRNTVIN